MSLTTIVGALLAVVARPDSMMERKVDALTRSHARLVDHIEDLERELDLQRSLTAHWKDEAQNLARSNRELREAEWRQYARQNLAQAEAATQYADQHLNQQDAFGLCNCVPSRSQTWARNELVESLNHHADDITARLRP